MSESRRKSTTEGSVLENADVRGDEPPIETLTSLLWRHRSAGRSGTPGVTFRSRTWALELCPTRRGSPLRSPVRVGVARRHDGKEEDDRAE